MYIRPYTCFLRAILLLTLLLEIRRGNDKTRALDELPSDAVITHVNSIGAVNPIHAVKRSVDEGPSLVAYSGLAIMMLKALMGFERVICFGDSDNDLSMFEAADESYAPANAIDAIKSAATAVIGHHHEEGVARFLRERFSLDAPSENAGL